MCGFPGVSRSASGAAVSSRPAGPAPASRTSGEIDRLARALNRANLAVYPVDEWNGKFREIRIRAKRPGVRLRHRTGYFAQPEEPAEDWYRSGVLGAAMWNPTDATGLGMTVHPLLAAPDALDVDVRIDVRDLSLQQAGERWRGQLDVWLVQLGKGDPSSAPSRTWPPSISTARPARSCCNRASCRSSNA